MSLSEALNVAEEEGMDLVEMSDNNGVSICKLMNYSKFLYEQKKAKKVQKKAVLKEIKMGCNIADHDIKVSAKKALNILNDGDKIKVMVIFKGRQVMFANEQGKEILEKFLDYFEDGFVICRFSGTEPLLRIFAESTSKVRAKDYINTIKKFLF